MTDKNTYLRNRIQFIIYWIILIFSVSYITCRQSYNNRNLIRTIDERTRLIEQRLKYIQEISTISLSDTLNTPSLTFQGIDTLAQ